MRTSAVVACLVVAALTLGFLGGIRWATPVMPTPDRDALVRPSIPERGPRPPRTAQAEGPSTPGPSSCEAELDLARDMIAEFEAELYGTPVPWTDEIPESHRPEAVKAGIRKAFDDCDIGGELIGFDCDEAPCFAVADTTHAPDARTRLVNECRTWNQAWGTATSETTTTVTCADGSEHRLLMISPGTKRVNMEELMAMFEEPDGKVPDERRQEKQDLDNAMKRHQVRAKAAEEQICAQYGGVAH